jgi:hypothetical protein
MFIDYIDLPTIPVELLEHPSDIISKGSIPIGHPDKPGFIINPNFSIQRKLINKPLKEWLYSVFNYKVTVQYLLLNSNSSIHKDPKTRPQAYNYVIDTGGPNVVTTVYDEDRSTVLKSLTVPAKTWYCLDTGRYHGVTGIEENTWRILLSIDKG